MKTDDKKYTKMVIENEYHEIIKVYQNLIHKYRMMMMIGFVVWFWMGYWYGVNHDLFFALAVWCIVLLMYIYGESLRLILWQKK